MSRASTPPRKRSASRPVIRYLYSGEESKTPTALRTPKYSCLQRSRTAWPTDSRPSGSTAGRVELSQTRVEGRRLDHGNSSLSEAGRAEPDRSLVWLP